MLYWVLGAGLQSSCGVSTLPCVEGGQKGTAIAWANLMLLGTTHSEAITGTQEEIVVCLFFFL